MHALRRAAAGATLALGLLTILPVRARTAADGLRSSAPWFPLVGALIGAGAAGVRLASDRPVGSVVASVLAVIWLVGFTGALHVDGLGDCADALGVRGGRDRRLSVMRESTIGTFGTLAIVFYALLLSAAIAGLENDDVLPTLVAAGALSRWSALVHSMRTRPARPDGLGAAFTVRGPALAAGTVATAIAVIPAGTWGLVALVGSALLAAGTAACAARALGGRTGDTLGATIALTEVLVVLLLLAKQHA
jgi:adenosylcobinamide-GDP ribazoletransferase